MSSVLHHQRRSATASSLNRLTAAIEAAAMQLFCRLIKKDYLYQRLAKMAADSEQNALHHINDCHFMENNDVHVHGIGLCWCWCWCWRCCHQERWHEHSSHAFPELLCNHIGDTSLPQYLYYASWASSGVITAARRGVMRPHRWTTV